MTLTILTLFLRTMLLFCSAKLTVVAEEARDGYKCQKVEYSVNRDKVTAYLLIPDIATRHSKVPGLVLLHDHGARFDIGKEKLVKPLACEPEHIKRSSRQWIDDNFDGVWFGDSLARCGYVVLVPDVLYWGSRSTELCRKWSELQFGDGTSQIDEPFKDVKALKKAIYEGQRELYDSLAAKGIVWAEKTLEEDKYAARILSRLKYVDRQRIGAFGWSMGAHRCWLLTAFSPIVKTGVALCWMTIKETCADPPTASDYSMLIPRLRDAHDFPDIAVKLAPKPFLFLAGTQDKLFPKWSVDEAYRQMQLTYSSLSEESPTPLRTEYFDGPHHCGKEVQHRIINYLDSMLKQH
jgi:Dienelactone hydrolase and related enzymes